MDRWIDLIRSDCNVGLCSGSEFFYSKVFDSLQMIWISVETRPWMHQQVNGRSLLRYVPCMSLKVWEDYLIGLVACCQYGRVAHCFVCLVCLLFRLCQSSRTDEHIFPPEKHFSKQWCSAISGRELTYVDYFSPYIYLQVWILRIMASGGWPKYHQTSAKSKWKALFSQRQSDTR